MAGQTPSSPEQKKINAASPDVDDKPHPTIVSDRRHHGRTLLSVLLLLLLLLLAGVTTLVLYLVYRPSNPHLSVTAAAIYNLSGGNATGAVADNLPAATTVSTSIQLTILIRNPNNRASIRYDGLSAYVTYRGQAVTPPLPMPPLVQEKDSTVTASPVLGGEPVPVSGDVVAGLAADQAYGVVPLRLVVLGRVKYKSGPFHRGWNGLNVRCDMLVGLRQGVAGLAPLLGASDCKVDA